MLKDRKATGYDNITAEMLQNTGENGLEILSGLFNKIWRCYKIWEKMDLKC